MTKMSEIANKRVKIANERVTHTQHCFISQILFVMFIYHITLMILQNAIMQNVYQYLILKRNNMTSKLQFVQCTSILNCCVCFYKTYQDQLKQVGTGTSYCLPVYSQCIYIYKELIMLILYTLHNSQAQLYIILLIASIILSNKYYIHILFKTYIHNNDAFIFMMH